MPWKKRRIKGWLLRGSPWILAKVPFKLCGKLQAWFPSVAETIGDAARFPSIKVQWLTSEMRELNWGRFSRYSWVYIVVASLIELEGFQGLPMWARSWPATYEGKPFISKCSEQIPSLMFTQRRRNNGFICVSVISRKAFVYIYVHVYSTFYIYTNTRVHLMPKRKRKKEVGMISTSCVRGKETFFRYMFTYFKRYYFKYKIH